MHRSSIFATMTAATALLLAGCADTTASTSGSASASTSASTPAPTPVNPVPAPTPTPAASVMVGGAEMLPTMNIVQNASKASNLTTLVAAVKAAGLVSTLSGPGPYTVFAPTNDAFQKGLAPGALDTLMKPANKAALTKVLTYHVIAGKFDAQDIMDRIKAGGGSTTFTTVEGDPLTASLGPNGNILLTSEAGAKAYVSQADVEQSNGVVHVINGVLIPNLAASSSTDASAGASQ